MASPEVKVHPTTHNLALPHLTHLRVLRSSILARDGVAQKVGQRDGTDWTPYAVPEESHTMKTTQIFQGHSMHSTTSLLSSVGNGCRQDLRTELQADAALPILIVGRLETSLMLQLARQQEILIGTAKRMTDIERKGKD